MYKILNQQATMKHEDLKRIPPMLREYFQLDESLKLLYNTWAAGCIRMKTVTEHLRGVRVVRQDPYECLVSFICSSNNNIKRITLMLANIRREYGEYLCTVSFIPNAQPVSHNSSIIESSDSGSWVVTYSTDSEGENLYSFPAPKKLAEASEEDLKSLGMGIVPNHFLILLKRVLQS